MNPTNISTLPIGGNPPAGPLLPPHSPPSGAGGPPRGLPPLSTTEMDAYLDKAFFDIFELIMNSVVINFLSVVGSVGNVMSIYILCQHGFENSTNVTLVSLAIADLLILVTLPLRKISLLIEPFNKALSITVESHVVCYHFLTLNRVWSLTSNAHVTLIAVERFLAVYFPFQVARWTTAPVMTGIVVALHIFFYIILIPIFTMFKLIWVFDPNLNETIAIPGITDFYLAREQQFNFYNSYIVNLLMGALFLFVTLVCCVGICIKLISMSKKRKALTGNFKASNLVSTSPTSVDTKSADLEPSVSQEAQTSLYVMTKEEGDRRDEESSAKHQASSKSGSKSNAARIDIKVVKLLLIVCFVYLGLIFPSFLLFVFQAVYEEFREPYWRRVNFLATSVSMFLIALNSSLNFVIYIVNSQKFYGTFKQLMRCGKGSKVMKKK